MSQPNILLIMTDQQRFDSLGCYGFEAAHTPNLDQLATDGALFEHCYVNNPICTPSRSSLMTGKHLPGHGVYQLYDNLPEDQILFTEHLQRLGYHTALFGKLHVCSRYTEAEKRHPHDGFDVYEWCLDHAIHLDSPFNGYAKWLKETDPEFYDRLCREGKELLHIPREVHMPHWAAERTIDYVNNASANEPFFGMGNRGKVVNIWQWRADWQTEIETKKKLEYATKGMDLDTMIFGGEVNPVDALNPFRDVPVEELNAEGFGTLTPQPQTKQNVLGKGVWKEGKWSVVFFRTLDSLNKWDIKFERKNPVLVAFAIWDGKHQDRNGRKVVSMWQRLKPFHH